MSAGQYVATRPFPTTHRQYEIGDMIDTSRITSSELNAGVTSGAIEPAKFIDTAARLAALNPVLGPGVHAYETDTGVHKIGTDGVTRYNDLDQVGTNTYGPFESLVGALGTAKKYRLVAGALRNDGSPNYWTQVSGAHAACNAESYSTDTSKVRINYPSLGVTNVVSFIVSADETLAQAGYIAGCSVGLTYADLYLKRVGALSDYVSYNGSAWVSTNGVYTGAFSAGVLTLTHAKILGTSGALDVSVSGRGGVYVPNAGSASDTTIAVEFRDWAGTLITTPDTNMKVYVTHGAGVNVNPQAVDTTAFPTSNLWYMGVFEVA